MPFMDVLLNRLARGEAALEHGAPGDPVPLPDLVTDVRRGDRDWRVEGGGLFQPPEAGVYYLRSGRDTIGAISVNPDPARVATCPGRRRAGAPTLEGSAAGDAG